MMMKKKTMLIGAAAVLAGAMSPMSTGSAMAAPTKVENVDRVYFGKCVSGDQEFAFLAGIAAIILPKVIDRAISGISGALKNAAAGGTKTTEFKRLIEVDPANIPRCMQIVRGSFWNGAPADGSQLIAPPGIDPNQLSLAGIYLSERPDVFFEIYLRQSKDKKALALAPLYAGYFKPLKKPGGRLKNNDDRSVLVQVSFHPADSKKNSDKAFGAEVMYGKLSPGTKKEYAPVIIPAANGNPAQVFFDHETSWFSAKFSQSAPAKKTTKKAAHYTIEEADRLLRRTAVQTAPKPGDLLGGGGRPTGDGARHPYNLSVTFTETADEDKFMKFVSELFEENKDGVAKGVKNAAGVGEEKKKEGGK